MNKRRTNSPAAFDNPASELTRTAILKMLLRDVTVNEDNR